MLLCDTFMIILLLCIVRLVSPFFFCSLSAVISLFLSFIVLSGAV